MLFRNSDIVLIKQPFSSIAIVCGVTFTENNFAYDLYINGIYYRAIKEEHIVRLVSRDLTEEEIDFHLEMLYRYVSNNEYQYIKYTKYILKARENRKIKF